MSTNQSKRELLRNKKAEQKRRRIITFALITLGVIALFASVALLPDLLIALGKGGDNIGFSLGDPNAPVQVTQFSSYSCGFCKDFSDNVEKGFIANYVDTGDVYYRYINLPSNSDSSYLAAKASYCADDQNSFFEYKDFLYAYASAADGFSADSLVNYAASAGLNVDNFQRCLEANTFTNAYVEDIRYAQSVGVTGTPTFLINGELYSSTELISEVEALLAE